MSRVIINSRKTLLKTKLFSVDALDVHFGNKKDVFHGIKVKPAGMIIALTEKHEIFLTKQYRYLQKREYLEIPAGMIEDNEEPMAAAKRELEEEIGLGAKNWRSLVELDMASGIMEWPLYYFLATDLYQMKQKLDPSEALTIVKIPLKVAIDKIYSGEIMKQSSVTGILLIESLLQKGKLNL